MWKNNEMIVPCNAEVNQQDEECEDKELYGHRKSPSNIFYDDYCNEQTYESTNVNCYITALQSSNTNITVICNIFTGQLAFVLKSSQSVLCGISPSC